MSMLESNLEKSIVAELSQLGKTIELNVKQATAHKKYISQLVKAFESGDSQSVTKLLRNDVRASVITVYPVAKETFEKLGIWTKRITDADLASMQSKFEEYCQKRGLGLRGRLPKMVVDELLGIEINETARTAKIGSVFLRGLDWHKVESTLEKERQRIWQRGIQPSRFRDDLISVHNRLLRIKPNPVGWVRLEDVYQELKRLAEEGNPEWKSGGRLVAYYKDEFSADLSMLWRAQADHVISPPYIEFSGIRDPRLSYKIVLSAGRVEQYGHIRPRREAV
jgi:hypothetical protein